MSQLTILSLDDNELERLPREIGQLRLLQKLMAKHNRLASVPAAVGQLPLLRLLQLQDNQLQLLPVSLRRLPLTCRVIVNQNHALRVDLLDVNVAQDARHQLDALTEASSHMLASISDEAATLAIGLQELDLPALVTLEIIDAAFVNAIPMHKKWDLVVAVKHWHQRHAAGSSSL